MIKLNQILLLFFLTTPLLATTIEFKGRAYDLQSGRLIYIEHHKEKWKDGRHIYSDVLYKYGNGKVFAKKRITFARSQTAPTYRMRDYRDGYTEGASRKGSGFELFARRKKTEALKKETIKNYSNLVVDGGFDYFVRQNWRQLNAGKTMKLRFAVPIEQDFFTFRVYKISSGTLKGRNYVTYRLQIDSVVLRLFGENIDISYFSDNKRLHKYVGISNINDSKGRSYRARIVFNYPKDLEKKMKAVKND